MRVIAHLSDLHFGQVDRALLEPLARRVKALQPDLVVVSGDLTQRARAAQFRDARRFLDTLPAPQIVVPGNHDVPLYNLFQRFFQPLDKFRRIIADDPQPAYVDEEIALVGINSARSLAFKGGRINEQQIEHLRTTLGALDRRITKIVVAHHPAIQALARCGADILLAGHLHLSHAASIAGSAALLIHAGTATSTRGRGESNTFNALHVTGQQLRVERFAWNPLLQVFARAKTQEFDRTPHGWSVAKPTT
jgi:predicted MPP superfamily phosphohydrolase